MLRDYFKKKPVQEIEEKGEEPDGLFRKCDACGKIVYMEDIKANFYCCPKCGRHFWIDPWLRIRMTADKDTFEEWDRELLTDDPLDFPGYEEKLRRLRETTRLKDGIVTGCCKIGGRSSALGVMSADFMMGSMGTVIGERIARMIEQATKQQMPIILFCCSGGARMQEGIYSLMQMAKTSQALKRHHDAGLLYIPVLTDPTMGGVTASFAMLGDVILAESGATVGFAGARVIRQTIGGKLPEGFQSAEFLQKHGFVDRIVTREQIRKTLTVLLKSCRKVQKGGSSVLKLQAIAAKEYRSQDDGVLVNAKAQKETHVCASMNAVPWDRVLAARSEIRPHTSDYITSLFGGFMELHGDRLYGDDRAVIGGISRFEGQYIMVIGQQKGRDRKEKQHRNYGMVSPEGYRKSLRLMKLAEKFHMTVVLLVDTPGAFCGIEAEERGQGEAIARNIFEMSGLRVPVLSIIIGEGGSGGALALAAANEVWMLENSVYSILSPEGFAAILWKDGSRASEAAACMKLTAADLYEAGVVERVIPETEQLDYRDMEKITAELKQALHGFFNRYSKMGAEEIVQQRYDKFRKIKDGGAA